MTYVQTFVVSHSISAVKLDGETTKVFKGIYNL
jgi:hypothetical protein